MAGERGRKSVAPRKAAEVIASLTDDQRAAVEAVINRLFREIRDVRPAWRQAWPTKQAMESSKIKWLAALIEAGCTDWEAQIEVGLARLRAEVRRSTIVGESGSLRQVIGFSILWDTGFGPLRLNFSNALEKESFDKEQSFDLTIQARC